MASRFQSRLVGTIILVSVGVIILPDVLDGKKANYQDDDIAAIPLRPEPQIDAEIMRVPSPEQDNTELPDSPVSQVMDEDPETDELMALVNESLAAQAQQSQQAQNSEQTQNNSQPHIDPVPVEKPQVVSTVVTKPATEVTASNDFHDSAWIIQLMALKNAENAERLVSDLRKRGYIASTKLENGFTRVMIGPDISKEKLEKQLLELAEITGAKGQLIKFKPLNP